MNTLVIVIIAFFAAIFVLVAGAVAVFLLISIREANANLKDAVAEIQSFSEDIQEAIDNFSKEFRGVLQMADAMRDLAKPIEKILEESARCHRASATAFEEFVRPLTELKKSFDAFNSMIWNNQQEGSRRKSAPTPIGKPAAADSPEAEGQFYGYSEPEAASHEAAGQARRAGVEVEVDHFKPERADMVGADADTV